MAAGLGFKTFTTGEVLTAANVNGYLMQGILVFASAAARDAAITSPQEGQFAYLKDTNVTTYYTGSAWANVDTTGMTNPMTTTGDSIYSSSGSTPARLGIGSTGQVLTVASGLPSWATPVAGGAYTSLASGSMAAASIGVDLTSISSAYEDLILVASGLSFSGINANVSVRFNNDSGNNYGWAGVYITNNVGGAAYNTASAIDVAYTTATANTNGQIIIRFPNYADTTSAQLVEMSGFVGGIFNGGVGIWSTADAVNRITVFAAGTAFDAGTYELFGVK